MNTPRRCLLITTILTSLLLSSCASFNGTSLEKYLGADNNLIAVAYSIADDLEKHAFPPLIPRHPGQPLITPTFVNTHDLSETSHFRRVIQEHLTSRFVQMGYTVKEIKMRKELQVRERSGETMLSRNLTHIQSQQKAQAVSVGTYSLSGRTLYISARLIDPSTSSILSSVDRKIIMDPTMLAMFGLQLKAEDKMDHIEEPKTSLMTSILY